MNYSIERVSHKEKDILYKLLQLALYDGSQYIDNILNSNGEFEYHWFDNYFTDEDRAAYFIKDKETLLGFVLVNEHLKFNQKGKCIAEFLILPTYRRQHIGSKVAIDIFNMYPGDWEVQPMENNPQAYSFWKHTIKNYTKGKYEIKNDGVEDVFIFNTNNGE